MVDYEDSLLGQAFLEEIKDIEERFSQPPSGPKLVIATKVDHQAFMTLIIEDTMGKGLKDGLGGPSKTTYKAEGLGSKGKGLWMDNSWLGLRSTSLSIGKKREAPILLNESSKK